VWAEEKMMRVLRIFPFDVLIIGVVTLYLGSLAWNEACSNSAREQGVADATQHIASGNMNFRVSGRFNPWFEKTAAIFRDRWKAELVHAHGSRPSAHEMSYDDAYNETMSAELASRSSDFVFADAYGVAYTEARNMWNDEFAAR
jgi:hypothetical protein